MTAPKRVGRYGITWAEAEAEFPESSAAWDRDGGDAWAAGRPGMAICIINGGLVVGVGTHPPYGWAIWHEDQRRWSLL